MSDPSWEAIYDQNKRDMITQLKRIADALENQNKILLERNQTVEAAKQIIAELKGEDKELQVDTITYDNLDVKEEVIMDLTEVTIMVITGKAILAVKKGFQKWIPKSTIEEFDKLDINEGDFLKDIPLTEAAEKWFPKKVWEKYEVKKR